MKTLLQMFRNLLRRKAATLGFLSQRWAKMVTIVELKLSQVALLILDLMSMLVVCSRHQRKLLDKPSTTMSMWLEQAAWQLAITP